MNTAVTSVPTTSRTAYTEDNEAVETACGFRFSRTTASFVWKRYPEKQKMTERGCISRQFPCFLPRPMPICRRSLRSWAVRDSTNAYSITGGTPLIDALFSVKYGLYSEKPEDTTHADCSWENRTASGCTRTITPCQWAFMWHSDFESRWNLETGNPADVQNSLSDALGAERVLELVMDTGTEGSDTDLYPGNWAVSIMPMLEIKRLKRSTATTWKGNKDLYQCGPGISAGAWLLCGRGDGNTDGRGQQRRNVGRCVPFLREWRSAL